MADNGKLQFFGQIVYPQTLSTNILNPDGTPAPVLPIPSPANVGKVPVVNAAGNGYELQAQSSGGITQSTVIERPESLPTATADSPDFVQTPDGTLYRKKAVEGGSLLGTWVFNDNADCTTAYTFNISFSCSAFPSTNFTGITVTTSDRFGPWNVFYNYSGGTETVYNGTSSTAGTWINTAYKTIQITDISALTNEAEFTSWLTANATKQGGGGGTVTYSYVALADA